MSRIHTIREVLSDMLRTLHEVTDPQRKDEDILSTAQAIKGYAQGYSYWVTKAKTAAREQAWNALTETQKQSLMQKALDTKAFEEKEVV